MNDPRFNYLELSNRGSQTVNLAEFEVGSNSPWDNPWNYTTTATRTLRLPERQLAPGESFLIVSVDDVPLRIWPFELTRIGARTITPEMRERADIELHWATSEWGNWPQYDSISPAGRDVLGSWNGRDAIWLRHYFVETELETDSVIIDYINASFTSETSAYKNDGASDAAGVSGATGNRILVRKFTVTEGAGDELDSWTRIAGIDIEDSEWLPLRFQPDDWNIATKKEYWTLGNHGNFTLGPHSLVPKTSATVVDFENKTITVPWGVRQNHYFTDNFEYSPGLAWWYSFSAEKADSAYTNARTNDTITFYAVGNTLEEIKFKVIALPSTNADNSVVPMVPMNTTGTNRGFYVGAGAPYAVTTGHALDTILSPNYVQGIGFNTRVDSLMKYLEKPTQASWEIVFVDGVERADLKKGDKLKVTAGNGGVKEYYIWIEDYLPNRTARLSAITWPDIPEYLKGIFGWTGDTIPSFSPTGYDYVISIPADISGVPALVAKTEQLNTTVEVQRATNLAGSAADRTVTFNTTAQDGVTKLAYRVTMNREKAPEDIQPYAADPFISEFVWRDQWASTMVEFVNPGNQILDMSNYMFVATGNNSPAGAIGINALPENWNNRYQKYIPGYRWVDQATWETQPAMVVQDLNVNTIVYPGDVFSIGQLTSFGQLAENSSNWRSWWGGYKLDIDYGNNRNPWGESIPNHLAGWFDTNYYLFRIDNDSIQRGLKPATDPNDFTLVDVFGSGDGVRQRIGGVDLDQIMAFVRKPHVYKGNPEYKGSWGTNADDSEWLMNDRPYWVSRGYGWPNDILMITSGIGSHFMNEVTSYKSTVASVNYKVSEGYSMEEEIKGVTENTSVEEFLSRILKADPGQTLTVKKVGTGAVLGATDKLSNGDVLEVLSADTTNTSAYVLEVTERGLSSNAILTSTEYFISVEVTTGGIYNVPYGTTLRQLVANVVVPEGASMVIIDENDAWVPFQRMNYDSAMVDVVINDQIFFEVTAENGTTKILYEIVPLSTAKDAFVLSYVYEVHQDMGLISFVPRGTTVETFLSNVIPVAGATIKVVDKNGLTRTRGALYQDDMLVVTSQDGTVTKTYYLDMLRTQWLVSEYFAFVTSADYTVDQLNKNIASPVAETPLAQFLAKLTPSFGATMAVYNKDGQPNATGILNKGDVLRVTSADGKIVASYALTLDVTSTVEIERGLVSVYPNPTAGKVSISGVEAGNRIRVFNSMGAPVSEFISRNSVETISLDNQASGIYFIVISNNDRISGTHKVIKKDRKSVV